MNTLMIVLALVSMVCLVALLVIGMVVAYYKALSVMLDYRIHKIDYKNETELYTRSHLVSFGEYLLSEERKERLVSVREGMNYDRIQEDLKGVYHADIENWKHKVGLE